ncbi:QuateRNAry ammonium compound-resistance protein [Granulibacter bethesdensis]|uniref:DMT family transporter n=1 Tax=Granulibacter bethesdensis TaxID=364410 RepID=UPI00090C4D69|nr:multidrug efflux SMR transporter [Granulibacter bethesdensis]APH56819.1 QuateRNAry ammonium compound-resistance protein [Granulibacter bethesdensis]
MPAGAWLLLAILSEVIGTVGLKQSEGFSKPGWIGVIALAYGAAFFMLAQALRTMPVGTAYAVWSGIGTAAIALIGVVFLEQKLDAAAMAGIGLIIAGVLTINLLSSSGH